MPLRDAGQLSPGELALWRHHFLQWPPVFVLLSHLAGIHADADPELPDDDPPVEPDNMEAARLLAARWRG